MTVEPSQPNSYKYCRQHKEYRHKNEFRFFWSKRCITCTQSKFCTTCETYKPKQMVPYKTCHTCYNSKVCALCNERKIKASFAVIAPATLFQNGILYEPSKCSANNIEYRYCYECRTNIDNTTKNQPIEETTT